MGLLGGHYLVDHEFLSVRVKEYGIPIGHMHPVTFLGCVETLDVPMSIRMICKTINVFGYDASVLLVKGLKKIVNSCGYPYIQKNHFVRPSFCFARSHGMVVSVASMASRSVMSCNL